MNNKVKVGRSVLETITVALYENPIILFREYVQNSLDAYNRAKDNAERTLNDFHVTINVDENCKKIVITDNGYGIYGPKTDELFKDRMLSIGGSDKIPDRTKYIGFRGIGRISGLPFCEKLIFRNKAKNSNKIQKCAWEGKKYRNLLDNENVKDDLESIINKIVTFEDENIGHESAREHFFEVTLDGYTEEIKDMMRDKKFKERLIRMLPLKYKDNFRGASKILTKYKSFMIDPLERFMISVKYNGEDLFKAYDDKFILGSDIVFWEIREKQKRDGSIGDKLGLLWFTFDKHLKSKTNDEYYGILTRSKNVLMGANDTFAQVANDNKAYVTTFREMAQALRGIYGELLINSLFLRDNSRRDWFLPDQHSADLSNIITDFMRRLHKYRYCASKYFRSKTSTVKEDLKKALDELVNIKDNQIDYSYFYEKEPEKEKEARALFSEQDIPNQNQSMKKCYDILMTIIETYFNRTKNRVLFIKLRAYIVNYFKKK
jgi:DNA-directed RNA polymerase subunit F